MYVSDVCSNWKLIYQFFQQKRAKRQKNVSKTFLLLRAAEK